MPDDVVSTPFGKFLITKGDIIGETLRAGTLWDGPGFLEVLATEHGRLGEQGVTILDIGANLGSFSVWLAAHGAWRVIAVEPVPATMRYLKANLDLNKATCGPVVLPMEVAAYDRETQLWLPDELDAGNLGGTSLFVHQASYCQTPVKAVPMDKYRWAFGKQVSLVKIDAQGCDGSAILGLTQTIQRDHPVIIFEWEEDLAPRHDCTLDDIRRCLLLWGYETHEWPSHPNNFVAQWRGGPQ